MIGYAARALRGLDVAAMSEAEALENVPQEVRDASVQDVQMRTRMLDNELKFMKSEHMRLLHEQNVMKERIKDNTEKIAQNKVLPYLVGNVVEVRIWHLPRSLTSTRMSTKTRRRGRMST